MNRRLILFITLALSVYTESGARVLRDSVLVDFRQSKTNIDTTYMNNGRSLEHARQSIDVYNQPDSNFVLTGVTVIGGASPEGSIKFNRQLSHDRAESIFDYIGARYELPRSLTSFKFLGRDWEGLRNMAAVDSLLPYREDVLSTLDEIIASYQQGETESQNNLAKIKRLHGGIPYRYMYTKMFPTLRASKLVLTFCRPRPLTPPMALQLETLSTEAIAPTLIPVTLPEPKEQKPFYMALKTNMLYDILAVPNIGAEFYLGKNLSIAGNWMYAWWWKNRTHRYWRVYGGDITIRKWFGHKAQEKPLTGHHIGIYGGVVTYDFEWGGRGYMGGVPRGSLWDQCNWFAGVEYGYSLPISRRLNIDFTLGLGYLTGKYRVYDPIDNCYVWKETRTRRWFGPTKAEISLVWLIGHGNFNKGKGGRI